MTCSRFTETNAGLAETKSHPLSVLDLQTQSAHGFDSDVIGFAQIATSDGCGHVARPDRIGSSYRTVLADDDPLVRRTG
jgi:hypothetical protein